MFILFLGLFAFVFSYLIYIEGLNFWAGVIVFF